MEKLQTYLTLIIISTFSLFGYSQNGTIRGTVTDAGTGEPVMFGTVLIQETGVGTDTDLDGAYSTKRPI